jgi:hypothetical protein
VRDEAPREKRSEALRQVALLRGAVTAWPPDLVLIQEVWTWFEVEVKTLTGSLLGVLYGLKVQIEELDDDRLLIEFRDRFGAFY